MEKRMDEENITVQSPLPEPAGQVEIAQGFSRNFWQCSICGRYSIEPYCIVETVLCDACAEVIANHYNYKHFGLWLTWPNPERERSGIQTRKAIGAGQRRRIYERDAYRCRYCNSHLNLTLDHVVPVSQNGPDSDDNLVTCCQSCNSRKHGRTPEQAGMALIELEVFGESEFTEEQEV